MLGLLLSSENKFSKMQLQIGCSLTNKWPKDRDREMCQGESMRMVVVQFPFQATNVAGQFNISSNISNF